MQALYGWKLGCEGGCHYWHHPFFGQCDRVKVWRWGRAKATKRRAHCFKFVSVPRLATRGKSLLEQLVEFARLFGVGEAELDSVSDRVPLVAELVESLVHLVAPLERLLLAQAEVDALAWRG